MTRTELNAAWIMQKRKLILKAISDIVMEQNLSTRTDERHKDFFRIDFQISMHMRGVSIRVSSQTDCVEHLDIYCMDMIFDESNLYGGIYKDRIDENIKKAMVTIKAMKTIALKYAKLNNSLK